MKTRVLSSLCLTTLVFLCWFRMAFTRDAPVITIPDQGQLSGFFIKMFRTQTIIGYLGVPYASAPIEERRFMPPFPAETWEGIRNGTVFQKSCWSVFRMPMRFHDEIFSKMLGINPKTSNISHFSEDCLYLNIFAPDGNYGRFCCII